MQLKIRKSYYLLLILVGWVVFEIKPTKNITVTNTFSVPSFVKIASLDSVHVNNHTEKQIAYQLYRTLYKYNNIYSKPQIVNDLAQALPNISYYDKFWKKLELPNSLNTKYTEHIITIKPKQYFSYKDIDIEITAEDFANHLQRIALEGKNKYAKKLITLVLGFESLSEKRSISSTNDTLFKPGVFGVKAIDKYTLKVITKGYNPNFIKYFTNINSAPCHSSKHYYSKLLSSGKFKLLKHTDNQVILELKNRATKYQKATQARYVRIVKETEPISVFYKFLNGHYDKITLGSSKLPIGLDWESLGSGSLPPKLKEKNIKVEKIFGNNMLVWGFNLKNTLIANNLLLRQAIALSYDTSKFINKFYNARAIPLKYPLPITQDNQFKKPLKQRRHQAQLLLKQAGFEDGIDTSTGKPLNLRLNIINKAANSQIWSFIKNEFKLLNINLVINALSPKELYKAQADNNYHIYIDSIIPEYPGVSEFLDFPRFNSIKELRQLNESLNINYGAQKYNDTNYDRLYAAFTQNCPTYSNVLLRGYKLLHSWVVSNPALDSTYVDYSSFYINLPQKHQMLNEWQTQHNYKILMRVFIGILLTFVILSRNV